MKALSIRQPWAWLIVAGVKPVENRTWQTKFRGPVLIHAAKGMTRYEYESACHFAWSINPELMIPAFEQLQRGGIVGSVEIVDCVAASGSPWFTGPFGFELANPEALPFTQIKGRLGFFEVDESLMGHG